MCGCGRQGCLEAYASATAVVARTREAMAAYRGPTKLRELLRDDDGSAMTSEEVFDIAAQGDPLARQIVDDTAYYLALGARAFAAELDKLGIDHTLELFEGKHGGITYRYPGAIRELALALE